MSGIRSTGSCTWVIILALSATTCGCRINTNAFSWWPISTRLTTHPDTKGAKRECDRVLAENIACGLDPEKVALYAEPVPETAELYLMLNMLAYKGELEKTATFKDKVRQQPDNVNAGLLTYPVLQAADILLTRRKYVPVGKDQEQHLEMARNFAHRFNSRYGEVFPRAAGIQFW